MLPSTLWTGPATTGSRPAELLRRCDWPGNIRQLESVIRYVCVLADGRVVDAPVMEAALLHHGAGLRADARPRAVTPREMAARHALEVLRHCDGNKTRACEGLHISRVTLRGYLRLLNQLESAEQVRRAA
jgi:DNA-binding NtrC family response regulator